MSKGTINVSVENIFPLIKKFLYSDHEIFLREMISNATDATVKLKHLTSIGETKIEYGKPIIEVKIDKKKKQHNFIIHGNRIAQEEMGKYINYIAVCGAKALIEKVKNENSEYADITGRFVLGF